MRAPPTTVPAHAWWIPGRLDQPTGGYRYDAAMIAALLQRSGCLDHSPQGPGVGDKRDDPQTGTTVEVRELDGRFPLADETSRDAVLAAMKRIDEQSGAAPRTVVVDGLALAVLAEACANKQPDTSDPPAFWQRHRLVALVHHPLCDETGLDTDTAAHLQTLEARALGWARRVVVTSPFTANRVRELFPHAIRPEAIVPALDVVKPTHVATGALDQGRARADISTRAEAPCGAHVHDRANDRDNVTARARWPRPDDAHPGPREGDHIRWLMVGSLSPRKGQDVLLDALVDVPEATLVLVGAARDPAYAAAIDQQIVRLGLAGRVTRIGACSNAELTTLYRAADAFVLPSRFEGFGMVITEAMQHRLPIVATDAGALRDTARETLQVPADDPQALAAAMRRVGHDAALRARLIARGDATITGWPSWDDQASRMAGILASIGPTVGEAMLVRGSMERPEHTKPQPTGAASRDPVLKRSATDPIDSREGRHESGSSR